MPAQHSQDEIDAIRRLIIAGYSRGQIAAQLGLTKNTVSGLAHRHIEKAIKGRSVSIGKPRRKKVGRPKLAATIVTVTCLLIKHLLRRGRRLSDRAHRGSHPDRGGGTADAMG